MIAGAAFVGVLAILGAINGGSDEPATKSADASSDTTVTSAGPSRSFLPPAASAPPTPTVPPTDPDAPYPNRSGQHRVAWVVDGDTIKLVDGDDVRVLGIDACAAGTPGGQAAIADAERLIQVTVTLRAEPGAPDRDQFGRLLRYVGLLDGRDFGEMMVPATHTGIYSGDNDASAAYLATLRAQDGAARDCDGPDPTPERETNWPVPDPDRDRPNPLPRGDDGPSGGCEPGYSPCVPTYPPDLNCDDVAGPYVVTGSDPHNLDGNDDGEGCE